VIQGYRQGPNLGRPIHGHDVWITAALLPFAAGILYVGLSHGLVGPLILGAIVTAALVSQPTASIAVLLVLAQELATGGGGFADQFPLLALGHQVYFMTFARLPAIEIIAVVATIIALLRLGREAVGSIMLHALAVIGVVTVATFAFAWGSGMSLASSLGGPIRPGVLVAAGLVLAATARAQPGGWKRVGIWVGWAFVAESLLGTYALATGRAPDSISVFYDSALPAFAAAALFGCLARPTARRLTRVGTYAALSAIVVLSGRRNVWLAAVVVGLIVAFVRRRGIRAVALTATVGGLAAAAIWFTDPGILIETVARARDAWLTVRGSGAEVATEGHISDIRYGLMYAHQAGFWGYGYSHETFPGFVFQDTGIMYVHNEFLLAWLRYGKPGLVLSVGSIIMAMVASRRSLRSSEAHAVAGAALIWMTPICCMSAPFLSTTGRWPLLFGLALGAAIQSASARNLVPSDAKDVPQACNVRRAL
jgi:hypothetical protein